MPHDARATRVLESARPFVMLLGATSAALAGSNVALMFAIAAITTLAMIRLFAMARS